MMPAGDDETLHSGRNIKNAPSILPSHSSINTFKQKNLSPRCLLLLATQEGLASVSWLEVASVQASSR